jgi:hypothetical protein
VCVTIDGVWVGPLGTRSNYSAIDNLHTLKFTTASIKPFQACCVSTSSSLAKASTSGYSSASRAEVLLSQSPVQDFCQFPLLSTTNDQLIVAPSLLSLSCTVQLPTSALNSLSAIHSAQSQCQSHIATDGQSVSKSSCRAPSGAYDQIFSTV